jgi:hypothetical protein
MFLRSIYSNQVSRSITAKVVVYPQNSLAGIDKQERIRRRQMADQAVFNGSVSIDVKGNPQGNVGELVSIAITRPDGVVDNVSAELAADGSFTSATNPYACTMNGNYSAVISVGQIIGSWSAASTTVNWVIGDISTLRTITATVDIS